MTRKTSRTWRIHPGEILREEFLRPKKISARTLSKWIGIPSGQVNEIVLERRGISAEMALLLAKFFGTSQQFWMNLQRGYDARVVKVRS